MYNDAWDDYYDDREDAREDWQDHREDLADERGDRAENRANSGPTRRNDPGAAHRAPGDAAGEPARAQAQRSSGARRHNARRPQQRDATGTTHGSHRQHEARGYSAAARTADQRAEQRQLGRILGIFERTIGTLGQSAWRSEPQQRQPVARRRRPAPVSDRKRTRMTTTVMTMRSNTLSAADALAASSPRALTSASDAARARRQPRHAPAHVRHARRRRRGARSTRSRPGTSTSCWRSSVPKGRSWPPSSDPATARSNRQVFTVAVGRAVAPLDEGTPIARRSSSATRTGRSRCRSSKRRTAGDSTPPPERKKCWRGGSDATSWRRSRPAAPTSPRSSATRNRDTTASPRACYATNVQERSGQGERPVLAGRARPEAESAWRPGGAGGGGRAPARQRSPRSRRAFHGYYFKILTGAGSRGARRRQGATSSRARCLAASRSSPGRRSTTPPAS